MTYVSRIELYDKTGQRKYLSLNERSRFFEALNNAAEDKRLFCLMLFWTGARISEVLNLRISDIDLSTGFVTIESLKKRRKGIFRRVPLPASYSAELDKAFKINEAQLSNGSETDRLWPWSRSKGSRMIRKIMADAQIQGIHACPKGLRHSFAIHCATVGIPITVIKKWLGHSSILTTAIYMEFVGREERDLAKRLWNGTL